MVRFSRGNSTIHLYYERPHLWSLLPVDLSSQRVLDIGCGSGWYAEQLLHKGANVTALDASPTMVELTRRRLDNKGHFHVANLEQPLDSLEENSFDIIIAPLVIHYVKDWSPFFLRLASVLKQNGLFIFSTHQPQTEVELFNLKSYFDKVLITDTWPKVGEVQFYHHTLHELGTALHEANFVVEQMLEPQPLAAMRSVEPVLYETIMKKPWLLFIRAKKLPLRD